MEDGWGLATDGEVLFGTDGSSTLYHIDPQTCKVLAIQNPFDLIYTGFSGRVGEGAV